jgi:hypothetical protein
MIVGTTWGTFQTAVDPEEYGVSRRLRIAAVYSVITEDEQFMENLGVNRGAKEFKIFDEIDAAWEWVRANLDCRTDPRRDCEPTPSRKHTAKD